MANSPNIVFVFSDQHRAEAAGYAGNKDVLTPCMDKICSESMLFTTAVSGTPVSSPYRGSLLTGQYPAAHGIFVNDVSLNTQNPTIAEVLSKADYATAYIGKWHLDGRGRSAFIPKERRFGFEYWKVLECTHNYNKSHYYGDSPEKLQWEGYDAYSQTEDAIEYIKNRKKDRPSDHGDMLCSHGMEKKQKPWDESILVPFILHYPRLPGNKGGKMSLPFNAPDIMPTLLGLCGIEVPETVEGKNFAPFLKGEENLEVEATLISCYHPFGEFSRNKGGKEYRGIRTERYTYVKDLDGPWLLYDNEADPYQVNNLCGKDDYRELQSELENILLKMLDERNDKFMKGEEYLNKWGYAVDETGTVPYTK